MIVAESAPRFTGHDLAKSLGEAGIDTTVITDSAVYAIMARVNQVGKRRRRRGFVGMLPLVYVWEMAVVVSKSHAVSVPVGPSGLGACLRVPR